MAEVRNDFKMIISNNITNIFDFFKIEHELINDGLTSKSGLAKDSILNTLKTVLDVHETAILDHIENIKQNCKNVLSGKVPDSTKKLMSEFGFKDLEETDDLPFENDNYHDNNEIITETETAENKQDKIDENNA